MFWDLYAHSYYWAGIGHIARRNVLRHYCVSMGDEQMQR